MRSSDGEAAGESSRAAVGIARACKGRLGSVESQQRSGGTFDGVGGWPGRRGCHVGVAYEVGRAVQPSKRWIEAIVVMQARQRDDARARRVCGCARRRRRSVSAFSKRERERERDVVSGMGTGRASSTAGDCGQSRQLLCCGWFMWHVLLLLPLLLLRVCVLAVALCLMSAVSCMCRARMQLHRVRIVLRACVQL